jgi:UDP-N-acetylglucosamine 2-epimerase (non-hydrolysing)
VAHVEAGLRSNDMNMPEEVNRIITDNMSTLLFTPSQDADQNLIASGIDKRKTHFVGNVMIDTLVSMIDKINKKSESPFDKYAVVTLHRPSNVDDINQLRKIIVSLNKISKKIPLVFPIHPRTQKMISKIKDVQLDKDSILLREPLGYLEFLSLVYHSNLVITDSGGIQEETTYLDIPCLTMRQNTERPVTISIGSNTLVLNLKMLENYVDAVLNGKYKKGKIPPKWDGKASERIAKIVVNYLSKK